MIASFILSRTLVPTLALYLLKPHAEEHAALGKATCLARLQKRFESGFADTREGYRNLLALAMTRRRPFVFGFLAAVPLSMLLVPFLGAGFLPLRGFRPDHPACPHRPPAPASRTPPSIVAEIEREVRRVIPGREICHHRGQYRPHPELDQS